MTLNRGEGGQNKIGSNLSDVLGVLRAEELLTILKGLEARIGTVLPEDGGGDRDAGRSRLIRAMIEAYYLT